MNGARLTVATAVASATVLLTAGAATAAPKGDPNQVRTANPATACAAIPATLAQFDVTAEGFHFPTCVRTLARGVPEVDFGDPYDQCEALEEGIESPFGTLKVTYPYTFHDAPDDPFPNLRAHNRRHCAIALWTFHTIESYLPEGPPPGEE